MQRICLKVFSGWKELAGISSGTLARFSKNEIVSTDVLEKICEALDCQIGGYCGVCEGSAETKEGENGSPELCAPLLPKSGVQGQTVSKHQIKRYTQ
jgi:hypothetical protein